MKSFIPDEPKTIDQDLKGEDLKSALEKMMKSMIRDIDRMMPPQRNPVLHTSHLCAKYIEFRDVAFAAAD